MDNTIAIEDVGCISGSSLVAEQFAAEGDDARLERGHPYQGSNLRWKQFKRRNT